MHYYYLRVALSRPPAPHDLTSQHTTPDKQEEWSLVPTGGFVSQFYDCKIMLLYRVHN